MLPGRREHSFPWAPSPMLQLLRNCFPLITIQFPLLQPMAGLSQVVAVHAWATSNPIFSIPSNQVAEDSNNVPPRTFQQAKLPPLSHPSLYLITLAPSLVGGPVIDFLQVTGSFGIWEQLKQDAVTPEWYHRC